MRNIRTQRFGNTERKTFSRIKEVLDLPNLIEVQKNSYDAFVREGIREVFDDFSPIVDYSGRFELQFLEHALDFKSKYSENECRERDATYAAPLKIKVRLIRNDTGEIMDQEVFMGDFPLMTDNGSFIINGAERVVVSQLVRSPGVYAASELDKSGKRKYDTTVIPNRGAWLEFVHDANNNILYVHVDRNRKLPATVLLRAIGISGDDEIAALFDNDETILRTCEKDTSKNEREGLLELYKRLRPGEIPTEESIKKQLTDLLFDAKRYDLAKVGRYKFNKKLSLANRIMGYRDHSTRYVTYTLAENLSVDVDTAEGKKTIELGKAGDEITEEKARAIQNSGVNVVYIESNGQKVKVIGNNTVDILYYLKLVNPEFAKYDFKALGINEYVNLTVLKDILAQNLPVDETVELISKSRDGLIPRHITREDIIATVSYNLNLKHGVGQVDNIDHLGNRRVRSVGELLQNQFRIGIARLERVIRERMAIQEIDKATPQSLINVRPVSSAIKEFFGSSQLSQFMDQSNPIAELTHKRKLSALGPGGLNRERATFDVRDVHYSHYGRMCPIETPEGPNIGLISYLASFARINEYGFIEAPYRRVNKETGVVTDEVVYMTADVEDNYMVAQANEPLTEDNKFARPKVNGRYRDQILEIEREKIDFMDVSPKMVVSVATACIPFLENDDANRALMGSNMQRQAVPLLKTESPIVGTGMEYKACLDSGVAVVSKNAGVVESVDADKIVIREDSGMLRTYELTKFKRSNAGTCTNQRPIVNKGERIEANQIIGDGPATSNGELSLGKNALIGFMTWEGYNYEDAVLLNENLVKQDKYTSIHIEEYETEARDTKLGPEEITRDIPNVGEDALKDLDENGIIRIGAEVRSGDILVGKVTPKGETELTAEERLLRAIFGEKAREVRDNSLKVPHGEAGTIIDVKIFTRENCDELSPGVNMLVRCYIAQKRKISVGDKMAGRHGNKGVVSRILPQEDMPFLEDGTPLDICLNPLGVPSRMNIGQVLEVHLGMAAKALGWKIMTPVFDGAHEADIRECFKMAQQNYLEHKDDEFTLHTMDEVINPNALSMSEDGKFTVYDGRTGEKFDNRVTVGYMYYLKLHHLVDDKIHARSVGPYSLVTQQPLGGKAQFGGQRFGEMEVWALEAYGAAYTLQEILTVKSDDTVGRVKTYEAIVKGQNVPKPGVPEAFKVLVKELQSLGLDLKVLNINNEEIDLKQSFDEDEELVPQPAIEDHIDFGVDEGDLDEGFMAEDENGTSELEGSAASDESDLFLNDGE